LDILEHLVSRTGESASLGVRERNSIVVLLRSESDQLLRFDRPIGTRVQISTSAMGRSLLAFGPKDVPDAVKALGPLQSMTEHSVTSARVLEEELRTVRGQGFAVITDEQYVGLRSIGAPVLGSNGVARAAVAIQGPVARVADASVPATAEAVMDAANELAKIPQLEVLTSSFLAQQR
jgi:IclR family acetate operon transcriptional repressor